MTLHGHITLIPFLPVPTYDSYLSTTVLSHMRTCTRHSHLKNWELPGDDRGWNNGKGRSLMAIKEQKGVELTYWYDSMSMHMHDMCMCKSHTAKKELSLLLIFVIADSDEWTKVIKSGWGCISLCIIIWSVHCDSIFSVICDIWIKSVDLSATNMTKYLWRWKFCFYCAHKHNVMCSRWWSYVSQHFK